MLLLILIVIGNYKGGNSEQLYKVYVNSSYGTTETSCWTEGLEIPCEYLELTLNEAKQLNDNNNESAIPGRQVGSLHQKLDSVENDNTECPTWMHYSNNTAQCVCGTSHYDMVKCNATINETYIIDCHLMSFDYKLQRVIAGLSFYGCIDSREIYHLVPANRSQINEVMCNPFFRDGRLCGACKKGYSPLVYSYQLHCKQCSEAESKYNWAKYLAVAFIPLTVFYVLVVLLKFNANSPPLHGFVFFAQSITIPPNTRIFISEWQFDSTMIFLAKLLATLYGIWNLDFFRTLYPDICLRVTTLQTISLDYLIAFYPLILIIITYVAIRLHSQGCRIIVCMWDLIKRCFIKFQNKENIKTSMIDVFATFLLLSYYKTLSVNFDLLAFTIPIDSSGKKVGRYLYYDASYEHFGPDHLPYGILALLLLTIFNFLPFLLLLFYPMKWFQRCLNRFRLSHLALHTFVDSFTGCYKDGTEQGTRDCRYFAALFLFLRMLLYIAYHVTPTVYFYGWSGLIFTGFTILLIVTQPYKTMYKKYNTVTTVIFGILTMIILAIMNLNIASTKAHQAVKCSAVTIAILIALPLLYVIGLAIEWIRKWNIFMKLLSRNRMWQKSLSESSLLGVIENQIQTYNSLS